jgi:serine/threonine-protein kinase PknG
MNCTQPGCGGALDADGYCEVCGTAASASAPAAASAASTAGSAPTTAYPSTGRRSRGRTSARQRLGAGLVEIPAVPYQDPAGVVMVDPMVPENRRFCGRDGEPVGRSRDGAPGRTEGFCRKCGTPFSFTPKLATGDVVAGQYEVVGPLAHGGMGWVYLARDRNVSDRWVVLKGLLNTGDQDAMVAALAERRFLAEVEHPNIVKIFNFVQHESSGYIVMEYVGGHSLKQIVAERRRANGGEPDPLPAGQAIAYMLEILPALGYLHHEGLLFCDFKLDNVIQTQHSLKLIDLGGVYRIDEPAAAVFGTVGYQAPEIAEDGPSVVSDLFTVARTLALLCFDFRGYQSTYRFTLPRQESVPLFSRYDSLYRLLCKGTAQDPDDRFQSADEMAEQLYGVLREIVATEEDRPVPAPSTLFTGDLRALPGAPDWRRLPLPQVDSDDAASGFLASAFASTPELFVAQLRAAPEPTVEVQLRLARALIEVSDRAGAEEVLAGVLDDDPWEWRVSWYRGVAALAHGEPALAIPHLSAVYRSLPGELAPKLALGVAAESAGDHAAAIPWYEIVARTDPGYTTAAFGLARCRLARGERAAALAAYECVPESSSAHLDAQIARIDSLCAGNGAGAATLPELVDAGSRMDHLALEGRERARLHNELLRAALALAQSSAPGTGDSMRLLGCPVAEHDLRIALEGSYRALARFADGAQERIALVDAANRVRPRTWT